MTDIQIRSRRLELEIESAALARAMAAEKEYRSTRLTIAATIYADSSFTSSLVEAIEVADRLMAANQNVPIPPEVLAQYTTNGSPHVS